MNVFMFSNKIMEYDVVVIILLMSFFIIVSEPFLTPLEISETEESFVKGEIQYILLNHRVTWNEAEIFCESYKNGSLAIINTNDIVKFISIALSESNLEIEDLWIGARAQSNDSGYIWLNGNGIYTPDEHFIKRGVENFENISRDCLAFARSDHDDPHFINLECILQRAFICEKPFEPISNGTMTTPEWIPIGKYKYGIFYDGKTWKQSIRECRKKHKAHLASFRNNAEISTVAKFLLIGRPSLENAWIGGHYKNGHWSFISESNTLPEIQDPDTLFPPWRPDRPVKHYGCLLLDRHLTDRSLFIEARCERRRSYICCKKQYSRPDTSTIEINNIKYIVYFTKKTWEDAVEQCRLIDASLIKVTNDNIHDVTYIMGENVTEVNHIWIGGRLDKTRRYFYWIIDNQPIPPNNQNITYYPPWYDNIYSQEYGCLNMDRENHNRPMFYGAACDTPQVFICEK